MVALTSNSDPTTSSYIPNDFEPLEKSNITTTPETTFRRPDLPHIYIGNCVSLYNSGLYEESSAVDLSNRIGLTSAFERRTFLGNILSKDAVFKSSKKQQSSKVAIVSKYVHLTPHKHSDMLHHIHRQREAPHFPIRYFVAISHSGHSISPHNKHIWAKWEGEEEKATDVIINYDLPLSICFGPSRLERIEELEIFPLRYSCHEMNKPKNRTSKTGNFKRILQKRESSTGVTTEKHLSSAHEDPYHQLQFSTPLPTVPFEEVVIQKPTEELQNADEPMHQSKTRRILAFALFHIHTKNGKGGEQKVTAPAEIEKFEEKLHDETSCPQKKYTAKIILKPGQSISTGPQTKLTDGKKDDEKKTTKKAQKKKKGKKAAEGGASTSVNSSSSSSSSSSDAEEEEVHVLVDHQQPAEQITKQQSKLGTTSPKYKLVIEPPPAHTTVETWHEETIGPEQVSTEIDEQGNIIKRTVRSEQVKHTIQTQSYQAVPINGHDDANQQQFGTEQPLNSHAYENGHKDAAENDASSGDLVSSKVVTTGNRSVETLTYKTEKDGMVETRVEHRITIHSNEDIDHDAELSRAILEATSMNPELKVEKVEVERG